MELKVKSGYLLISSFKLIEDSCLFHSGEIAFGASADIGVTVFFKEFIKFNDKYLLVKTEDVLVWIGREMVSDYDEVSSN